MSSLMHVWDKPGKKCLLGITPIDRPAGQVVQKDGRKGWKHAALLSASPPPPPPVQPVSASSLCHIIVFFQDPRGKRLL